MSDEQFTLTPVDRNILIEIKYLFGVNGIDLEYLTDEKLYELMKEMVKKVVAQGGTLRHFSGMLKLKAKERVDPFEEFMYARASKDDLTFIWKKKLSGRK